MGHARRTFWIIAFAVLCVALTGGVWTLAYRAALTQIAQKGQSDLSLAADRLTSQLFQTRELAVVLADHPVLVTRLTGADNAAQANALLQDIAGKTGTRILDLVDRTGTLVASSATAGQRRDITRQPLVRALRGALGTASRIEDPGNANPQRLFSFAAPVFTGSGPPLGALVAEVDMDAFEQNWPTSPIVVFFVNETGQIIVSNRRELTIHGGSVDATLNPSTQIRFGHTIWAVDAGPYLPAHALHLVRDLPVVNLQAEALIDTLPARQSALLQAAVAAALFLAFGAFLFVATERRRSLAASLAQEEAANALLEARVAQRTGELSTANRDLRREVSERRDAEAALKKAQAELVQAGKLSALGQMSAGISHELNQPLMAIRSFAENGAEFIKRDRPAKAAENLSKISDLARRMGRIIQNFRAFVRNESEPVSRIDLIQVIDSAVDLTAARQGENRIHLKWQAPAAPVYVRGGEVRLAQVFVNLINNSIDAMAGQDAPKAIEINITTDPVVRVSIRDTGPGIADPEKIFEPFYTTKAVGQGEEGMGLGLSISYGLVQSFGGKISGINLPGRGAMFTVELDPWAENMEKVA
ncbi:MAG TPA: sensor histidine kinase [Aliiroseovarius sp.]|nr:sensor histidine kinase [Aliiroseovarius sp.]